VNRRYDILIVGGGITGLTAAALLAQGGHAEELNITLADAGPRVRHNVSDDVALRVSAIATGSAELLESIGAWQHVVDTRACAYEQMRVWDESSIASSSAALRFEAAEFAVKQLGFIVENVLIQHSLLNVLDQLDVTLDFETKVESLDADLVIGADGARSFVRESAGIRTRDFPYGQMAFVTHLRPEKPHCATAWQRFLGDGPLGMLPLADGRISVVWSTTAESAERAMAASDEELGAMLAEASDYVLGELEVAGPRGAFPLVARHAEHYVQRGLALIGDAAHTIHPLAGQGANLGLQDAARLAATINDALENGEHPGDKPVLRRYERARKGENATMMHFMTGLNRLFASDSSLVREIRVLGMRLFNRSGPIRDRVVKVALGAGR
jgi:2-octaprenylphenol hydroxylase